MRRVILWSTLCVSACSSASPATQIVHERIIIDRSLSVPKERFDGFASKVVGLGESWANTAKPGATFGVWWFPADAVYSYPAVDSTVTMPKLEVPVHLARRRFRDAVSSTLVAVVHDIPPTTKTPLLEAIYYIESSVPRDSAWKLTIYSDLLHDGKTWSLPASLERYSDEQILAKMNELCPPVRTPPSKIVIVAWPGTLGRARTSLEVHQRVIRLYETFFERWAPECDVEIGSVY
jgi:hypothetical protein